MTNDTINKKLSKLENEICVCCNKLTTTDGEPTDIPSSPSNIRYDPDTGIIWGWDGDSWVILNPGGSVNFEQGISFDSVAKLGDDAAGTSEPGVLTSERFINQDGNAVSFVGESDSSQVEVSVLPDGTLNFDKLGISSGDAFITIQPLQTGQGNVPFNFTILKADNAGSLRDNNVLGFGWNLDPGGGAHIAGQTAVGIFIEDHYEPVAGQDASEFHIVFVNKLGTQSRPLTLYLDKDDPLRHSMAFQVPLVEIRDPNNSNNPYIKAQVSDANTTFFKVLTAGGTGGCFIQADVLNDIVVVSPDGAGMVNPTFHLSNFYVVQAKRLIVENTYGGTASHIWGWGDGVGTFEKVTLHANLSLTANVLELTTRPTYANDAAAGIGGLAAGRIYKTATGELREKL